MCVCRGRPPTVPIVVREFSLNHVWREHVPLFPPSPTPVGRRPRASCKEATATWAAPQPSSSDEVGPQ